MARLRLMTWNLLEGGRGAEGPRLDLITSVLRSVQPDVLTACEGQGLAEDPRLLADIAAAIGMRARLAPADDGAHAVLFTRPSIAVTHFGALALGGPRRAAVGVLRAPGLPEIMLAGCHLDARDPSLRANEIATLLANLPPQWPRVVMGDLNSISHEDGITRRDLMGLPLHHVERHVAPDGEPDTRVTRALAAAGLVDAWRLAHAGAPFTQGCTVPTAIPQPPRFGAMRLDYVFLSADIPAALTSCEPWREKPAPRASDHYPLVADLEPHAA